MTNLFKQGEFISHSGLMLADKIDCDALSNDDWNALADWFYVHIPSSFSKVVGVPTGGLKLAKALEPYAKEGAGVLICDDVLTTGKSMEEMRQKYPGAIGVVVFARTRNVPDWITARFVEQE